MLAGRQGNKANLLQVLHQQADQHNTDERHAAEIVNIFGGIDNLLTLILSSDIDLQHAELSQLQSLLSKPSNATTHAPFLADLPQTQSSRHALPIHDDPAWTYHFEKHETYIHSIFGVNTGSKLFNFLHSKYLLILAMLLVSIYIFGVNAFQIDRIRAIQFVPDEHPINIVYKYAFDAFGILLAFLIFLCVNKTCFRMILKSFEFWLKICAVLQWAVWLALYRDDWDSSHVALHIMDKVAVFALTVCMSLLDGLQISRWVKVVSGVIVSCVWTYFACYYTFYADFRGSDNSVITLFGGFTVSCIELTAPAVQVLAIFFWKQTVFMWSRDGRTASISYHPFIDWTEVNSPRNKSEDSYIVFSESDTEEADHDAENDPIQFE
eukprot:CAMPEP_0197036762 /NCGR_PEP_ID=MMETSP1384-20130603/14166_1 /TAXON_ID=29189 /ORGANISM="Ammonia sp." /LENGTH=379 /DNA_ID=CAMNT_0042466969 /DNA_START=13 /DNA_END=1152 /DNA_ORIENTATION=+